MRETMSALVPAALLLGAFGFAYPSFAQTMTATGEEREHHIANASIELFDRLCIKNAYDEGLFDSVMKKMAQRKLKPEEYKGFSFGQARSDEFYEVPILDGKENVVIGRASYDNGAHNCSVALKLNKKIAERHWMNLYKQEYRGKAKLELDKGPPLYFVNQGRGGVVMVQIGNSENGFILYYSYFQ